MKTIELTDEQWATLQSGEDVLLKAKPNPQWWPERGDYRIDGNGVVSYNTAFDALYRDFGTVRKTKEAAKKDRDEMRTQNRLLAYKAKFDPDYEPDWDNCNKEKHYVRYDHDTKIFKLGIAQFFQSIGTVYMSKHVALDLVEKLNYGEVVL